MAGETRFKNVGYLFNAYKSGNLAVVTIVRAFLSVPGHALFNFLAVVLLKRG